MKKFAMLVLALVLSTAAVSTIGCGESSSTAKGGSTKK
jgi:ABC-type oligopeptide transport system substrate-binding subunit